MSGVRRTTAAGERLTAEVEVELFRRMLEAAVLGQEWSEIQHTADGFAKRNRLHSDVAAAMLDAAPEDTPFGTWETFLDSIDELLCTYRILKQSHGPQGFRAILKAFLDKADYTRPILDDAEREALGLAGALKGGSQHAA